MVGVVLEKNGRQILQVPEVQSLGAQRCCSEVDETYPGQKNAENVIWEHRKAHCILIFLPM